MAGRSAEPPGGPVTESFGGDTKVGPPLAVAARRPYPTSPVETAPFTTVETSDIISVITVPADASEAEIQRAAERIAVAQRLPPDVIRSIDHVMCQLCDRLDTVRQWIEMALSHAVVLGYDPCEMLLDFRFASADRCRREYYHLLVSGVAVFEVVVTTTWHGLETNIATEPRLIGWPPRRW